MQLSLRSSLLIAFVATVNAWSQEGAAAASAPLLPPEAIVEKRGFNFTLLPKAFASNPTMEMTVFGERTDHGRTLPEPTPERPVYYVAHSNGFRPMGEAVGENPPMPEALGQMLTQALKARGYLAASDKVHEPALLLNYFWGSHSAMDLETAMLFPEQHRRQVLERAALVGGKNYVKKIAQEWALGSTIADRTQKLEYLRYQAEKDLYYVVVSAYDYASLAKGPPKLAWRTTMTVNAQGVNMDETLPPLILTSAYYFGRDSSEPVAIRRDLRRGTVNLGPLRVIESGITVPVDAVGASKREAN